MARRDILNAANNSYRDTQRVQSAAKGSDLENINDWLLLVTHDPRSKFVRKKANGMLTQAGVSNGGD